MEKEKLISLVCAVQQGESEAATNLYNAFHQDLYYHISKTVNDPALAEDLLQDTFIEIFQTIDQLNEPAAFVTWSKQIAYHRCTAYFRKRREILADEDEDGYSVFDTIEEDRAEFIPDEALDKEDLKQTIHAMIAQLPPEQRSALLMRYFDEISVEEIAKIQGVSEGTVKSRLNYGRKAIKRAVEDYEKKNDVKLHCVGIIPLLLWLFREYAVANKISLTATTASASYAAASSASVATTTAAPIVAESVKAGAKAAGKFAVKKLIAGIAAVAVVIGGVAVGLSSQTPQDSTSISTEATSVPGTSANTETTSVPGTSANTETTSTPATEPQKRMLWYGYGSTSMASSDGTRFDLEVTSMDESQIKGILTRSKLFEIGHQTAFTGTGKKVDNTIEYTIHFENPAVLGTIPTFEHHEIVLVYDITSDIFWMNDFYRVTMEHISTRNDTPIMTDETWSGYGKDVIEGYSNNSDHLFVMHIEKMSEVEIYGTLTVYHNNAIDHAFEFWGQGYLGSDNRYYYEIRLETSKTDKDISQYSNTVHSLDYNPSKQVFRMSRPFIIYLYSDNST